MSWWATPAFPGMEKKREGGVKTSTSAAILSDPRHRMMNTCVTVAGWLTLLHSYVTTLGIGQILNHTLATILGRLTTLQLYSNELGTDPFSPFVSQTLFAHRQRRSVQLWARCIVFTKLIPRSYRWKLFFFPNVTDWLDERLINNAAENSVSSNRNFHLLSQHWPPSGSAPSLSTPCAITTHLLPPQREKG